MTVETLNHMMTYVIESWMVLSTVYLGIGFTASFVSQVKNGLKLKAAKAATSEEVTNAERVAEVTAVAEKYGKSADRQQVISSLTVPGQ
ncbi:MAG: hypothetical protein AAGA46_02785 [Cyanobacteria bacterium P01_F01_bin.13]